MRAENPAALRFILQDDIYLLNKDKTHSEQILPVAVVEETPPVELNYLGKHKKGFLVLTHYTGHEFIADDHLTALESILKRKEHAIDDVAILNMAKSTVTDLDALIAYFKPQKLLILGEKSLPGQIEQLILNQPKQLANCITLYSFSFDDMMGSTDNKKAFWHQMKNL